MLKTRKQSCHKKIQLKGFGEVENYEASRYIKLVPLTVAHLSNEYLKLFNLKNLFLFIAKIKILLRKIYEIPT